MNRLILIRHYEQCKKKGQTKEQTWMAVQHNLFSAEFHQIAVTDKK